MPAPGTRLATEKWFGIGSGPLRIQTTSTNVLIAIADDPPAGFVGFTLSPRKIFEYAGSSTVFVALRPGSVAAGRGGAVRFSFGDNQVLIPASGGPLRITTHTGLIAS